DTERRRKYQRDPFRVIALLQFVAFAGEFEQRAAFTLFRQREGDLQRSAALFHVILRTLDLAVILAVAQHQRKSIAALHLAAARPRAVQRERALGAEQIRSAHRGQHTPVELLRRECDRHAQYGGGDLPLTQDVPEGLALAPHLDDRAAQRDAILAELQD